ncbi:putative diguanylate cyclase YedQ [compost metagenome]
MFRIDLRRLILWISLLSVILVLAGGLHASYLVQRALLLHNALEANRIYASKLAVTTDALLNDIRRYLSYSADMLADMEANPGQMADETRRQEQQLGHFNSSFVASPQGKVLAVSSSYPQLLGQQLISDAVNEALAARRPTISEPFQARNGRWQILYTQPIFSRDYRYLGFIAGSLYLHEDNMLDRLLAQHFYRDDSFLYVVDRKGTLIYHPDRSQLGKTAPDNDVFASARRGETGQRRFIDDQGRDMLAGYAPVPSTGWSIIAQRPVASTLRPLGDLLMATARNTLPLLLLSVALIWLLSRWIARPLGEMAGIAERIQDPDSVDRIRDVRSWYFEAAQLKRALLIGLSLIHHKLSDLRRETTTDTLTGLLNRRGLDEALALLQAESAPAAVVAIDIDHFKSINDRYGHAAGDQALQALANIMREGSRSGDTLARAGGEEFVMLLPGASMAAAIAIAQRLRNRLAAREAPAPITISAGVAHYPEHGATLEAVFKRADQTLYYAKNHGRDAVCVADDAAKEGSRLVSTP